VDPSVRVLAWRRTDENAGHSIARVAQLPDGWLCHGSEVSAGPDAALACSFRVDLDTGWETRTARVWSLSQIGERRLGLTADVDRRWWRDGVRAPDLDGCIDVDVAATPLTNTFPINRLAELAIGASVTAPVAWVDVPELSATRVDQSYQRLGDRRWRYSDQRHGAFDLTVDDDGLVVDYAGFATRITP
jgi:uncharacterized protein